MKVFKHHTLWQQPAKLLYQEFYLWHLWNNLFPPALLNADVGTKQPTEWWGRMWALQYVGNIWIFIVQKVTSRSTGVVKSIDVLVLWSNRSALFNNWNYYELANPQFQNFTLHYANLISARLLNKPYVNEVTLSKQNPALKCCQSLELLTQLKRELDLLMLKIWSL